MAIYTATGRTAGEAGSVTNEGRYLTVLESDLTHPVHADGFADKGDPVNIGNIVGVVCSESATAATDLMTVDTEGLYYLNVVASDGSGTSNVVVGDDLYLATGVVSKIATGIPFGKALTALAGSATAAVALVKVHMPIPEGTMVGTNFTDLSPHRGSRCNREQAHLRGPGSLQGPERLRVSHDRRRAGRHAPAGEVQHRRTIPPSGHAPAARTRR